MNSLSLGIESNTTPFRGHQGTFRFKKSVLDPLGKEGLFDDVLGSG